MDSSDKKPETIDEYLANVATEDRAQLEAIRHIIKQAAPDAVETISYGMPAFKQHGNLVYFAASKNHIGFYPTSTGIKAFEDELSASYSFSKGAVQFPKDQPLPHDLITRMVQYRVQENVTKHTNKQKKR